ncbi:helix-turn-helix transcriptional regulator [Pimelobacter simplex]|uniref:helix-turn-helix transcriptional regulator n=1 Tax=Nocardioides simplex TaxID=2045 RepID=UPI00214FA001|nr:helix-turn-helix domain-containing protein [Pimelobacter simplex]UUW91753.1 helix-turn-helix domain-containing protein [Pimelobacter simplex]UUW95581.1 helix-turn-helix domain-containing protein [Pimelobacter simplex]
MPEHLMDMHAIAELLGVSKQRVQQLAAAGKLPEPHADLRIGRVWLRADIEKWARETGRIA